MASIVEPGFAESYDAVLYVLVYIAAKAHDMSSL